MNTYAYSTTTRHRPLIALRTALAAIVALGAAATSGCAAAAPYNPSDLSGGQLSLVGQTCQGVMHVQPGEEHYVSCVESLSVSASGAGRGAAMNQARDICLNHGLRPGTPDLAECTLRTSETTPPPAPAYSARPVSNVGGSSYFATSHADNFKREQLACARVGLDPTTGAFSDCVANLQGALFAADNPPN